MAPPRQHCGTKPLLDGSRVIGRLLTTWFFRLRFKRSAEDKRCLKKRRKTATTLRRLPHGNGPRSGRTGPIPLPKARRPAPRGRRVGSDPGQPRVTRRPTANPTRPIEATKGWAGADERDREPQEARGSPHALGLLPQPAHRLRIHATYVHHGPQITIQTAPCLIVGCGSQVLASQL